MSLWIILLFGIVVLLSHFIEGITGFGCTVLAMPFAILLLGITVAKPTLTILAFLFCLYVVAISYKDILWNEYFKIIFFMVLGLPIGIWLFNKLPEATSKKILAIFMIIIALRGLYLSFIKQTKGKKINSKILNFIIFLAGCIHGAFTSGGPLLIIYATNALPKKENFRATLCMIWVTLNSVILLQSSIQGAITPNVLKLTLEVIPFLILGAVFGNKSHHKIKENDFIKLVYIVLLISTCFMFV